MDITSWRVELFPAQQPNSQSPKRMRRGEYDSKTIIPEFTEEAPNVAVTFIDGDFDRVQRTIAGANEHQFKDDVVRDDLDEELEDEDEEDDEEDDEKDEDDAEDEEFDDDFDEEFDEEEDEEDEDDMNTEPE